MSDAKIKALELANMHQATAVVTVARAEAYLDFLTGVVKSETPQQQDQDAETVAGSYPGSKRTRKSKVEAVADEVKAGLSEVLTSEPTSVDPAAEYKNIQQTVVNLIEAGKRDHVVAVLKKFDIPTFLNLVPSQYPEAQKLLSEGLTPVALA